MKPSTWINAATLMVLVRDGSYTIRELAELTNRSITATKYVLYELISAGFMTNDYKKARSWTLTSDGVNLVKFLTVTHDGQPEIGTGNRIWRVTQKGRDYLRDC